MTTETKKEEAKVGDLQPARDPKGGRGVEVGPVLPIEGGARSRARSVNSGIDPIARPPARVH